MDRSVYAEIANLLYDIFAPTRYAAAVEKDDGIIYRPMSGELTEALLIQHLKGEKVLGSYSLTETGDLVHWLAWDVDSNDMKQAVIYAKQIIDVLEDRNIPHAIEFSGGKGYHIWVFLAKPMPAAMANTIANFVREDLGIPRSGKSHVECYPKQTKISARNPYGNLIKIPLGTHPRTHSRSIFVDPENGWERGAEVDPLEMLTQRVNPEDLDRLLTKEEDATTNIFNAMLPFWGQGDRHALALNLAGYLANMGWSMGQTETLIENICVATEDDEMSNRLDTVKSTYTKLAAGEAIAGFTYLADTLPGQTMRILVENARKVASPPLVKDVENIRLKKDHAWKKVSAVSSLLWGDLTDKGKFYRTKSEETLWYDSSTHKLTDIYGDMWLAFLHKNYGINTAETFGNQVRHSLEMRALSEGVMVDVHRLAHWDGMQLYVNLGGAQVYICDGKQIREEWNGDCGVLFRTSRDPRSEIVPELDTNISAWDYLTNDLSFSVSADATARPAEQRELLKAWMLSVFFAELMETKPILCALGPPGSGKTSMLRRIIRVVEGLREDVLSLSEDKPDSLRASIEGHRILALDNLEETRAKWLLHTMNVLATGSTIELRKLFKTNETFRIEPVVYLAVSAVNVPFSDSTLHSRLLPLELGTIENILPETLIQRKIKTEIGNIWGSILLMLNECAGILRTKQRVKAPVQSRLADFTVFCAGIKGTSCVDGDVLMSGLQNLVDRQRAQMISSSPIVELIEKILETAPDDLAKWQTYGQLMDTLNSSAYKAGVYLDRINTPSSLKRHLEPRFPTLAKMYGLERKEERDTKRGRSVEMIRFGDIQKIDVNDAVESGNGRVPEKSFTQPTGKRVKFSISTTRSVQ